MKFDLSLLKIIFSPRMLITFLMGFSCGLPLLLTLSVLQVWMRKEGVDLATIGMMALVGLPYTLKFLWSPLLDRYTPLALGRRRGWMLIAQVLLAVAIAGMGLSNPSHNPWILAFLSFLVTFFSATQDSVVDAYRREHLPESELGLGSTLYVNGYRIGLLLASGGGLILADQTSFPIVYLVMAGCMSIGILTTLFSPEPPTVQGQPKTLRDAVVEPFMDYFKREKSIIMLGFILFYKLGDILASAMSSPFYVDLGFSPTEIGVTVKLFGFWATLIGGLLGGVIIVKIGIYRSLWIFGFLQMVSISGFTVLSQIGHSAFWLAGVIAFENLSAGMGTSAFIAFMASLTNRRFTATQYSLLTSLMGVPRVILSAPTGILAEKLGWFQFFIFATLMAIPGLVLLKLFGASDTSKEKTA